MGKIHTLVSVTDSVAIVCREWSVVCFSDTGLDVIGIFYLPLMKLLNYFQLSGRQREGIAFQTNLMLIVVILCQAWRMLIAHSYSVFFNANCILCIFGQSLKCYGWLDILDFETVRYIWDLKLFTLKKYFPLYSTEWALHAYCINLQVGKHFICNLKTFQAIYYRIWHPKVWSLNHW